MMETASLHNQTTTSHSFILQPIPTSVSIVSHCASQASDTCLWFLYTDIHHHRTQR